MSALRVWQSVDLIPFASTRLEVFFAVVSVVTKGATETARVMVFIDNKTTLIRDVVLKWLKKNSPRCDWLTTFDRDVDLLVYYFPVGILLAFCALTNKAQSFSELWNFRIVK